MDSSHSPHGTVSHRVVRYGLAYLLWLATIVLATLVVLALRDTFRFVLISMRLHRYTIYANSQVATLFLGFLLIILVIVVEHLYRTAVPKGLLTVRVLLVGGWLFLLLGLVHGTHIVVAFVSSGVLDYLRMIVAGAELLSAAVLLSVRIRLHHSHIVQS